MSLADDGRSGSGSVAEGKPPPVSSDDPRVVRAMEEYLAALESGTPPDRGEFLARHGEIAESLEPCLAGLEFVYTAAPGLSNPIGAAPVGVSPARPLGDYRIIREVGRGGMGVVYEAEQLSLGRRVALKVLPFAATVDPKHLQRFHNEARAAASLHHEHIVPVYGVGCERGVHYYAMQFVEGQALTELIRDRHGAASGPTSGDAPTIPAGRTTTPTPTGREFYRTVARLGVEAAEALEHAHTLGVVHRDVKPGNLMVDGAGKLWVMDFGLARFGADAGLTMTGDVVGTLRYMSPEQALARHGLVDHRTDIYALGATLYELLTGRPAVPGEDREEVLRRIVFEEPVPPRKLERAVPADLQTVVLKCLQTDPADRYQSAQELADDLRRWLEDKPIRARRIALRQRVGRWARRRPGVAAALFAAVLLGLSSVVAWDRERGRVEGEARRVASEAKDLWAQGRNPEALTAARRSAELLPWYSTGDLRPEVAGLVAEMELVLGLEEARLERAWATQTFYPSGAVPRYREAFLRYGVDPLGGEGAADVLRRSAARGEVAAALDDWSRVSTDPIEADRLGKLADAVDDDRGLVARARRAAVNKDDEAIKQLAAEAEADLPSPAVLVRLSWSLEGVSAWADAERMLRAGLADNASNLWVNVHLARVIAKQPRRGPEAVEYARAAVVLRPHSPSAWVFLGSMLSEAGRLAEAEGVLRRAIALGAQSIWDHSLLSGVLVRMGRGAEGVEVIQKRIELNPDNPEGWFRLGTASNDKTARVWDARTGAPLLTLKGHAGFVHGVSFSPDGSRIATASFDQTARVWDARTGAPRLELKGHARYVTGVSFSPDGSRIAIASFDQTARVWDARTGAPLLELRGHTGPVNGVSFSPDRSRLATASWDDTARVWDARTGAPVLELRGHATDVNGVAFSPDGSRPFVGKPSPGCAPTWRRGIRCSPPNRSRHPRSSQLR